MLTRRGWALGAAAVVAVALAGLFGIEELYALAAAAVILLIVSAAWVHGRTWRTDAHRQLFPARIAAGGSARVVLAVGNRSPQRSPVLGARDPFDGGRRWASFALAPLGPGQTRRAAYRVPGSRRGVFTLGPLQLTLTDPFGLVALTHETAKPSILTVYPRVDRIVAPKVVAGYERRAADGAARPTLEGDEFYAVREYRVGDDLRRVHWSSTARLDQLMIRQEEALHRGRLTVAVDLRQDTWTAEALETALSAVASVTSAGVGAGLQVRLLQTGRPGRPFGATAAHATIMLDDLARARPHPRPIAGGRGGTEPSLATVLGLAAGQWAGGGLVVVASDRVSDPDLASLALVGRAHRPFVVVVVETAHTARRDRAATPGAATVVRCGLQTPFAPAWDGAMLRAGQAGAWPAGSPALRADGPAAGEPVAPRSTLC